MIQKTMICNSCGNEAPIGFYKKITKKDGTIVRPSKGKRCLTIPMCACWMNK